MRYGRSLFAYRGYCRLVFAVQFFVSGSDRSGWGEEAVMEQDDQAKSANEERRKYFRVDDVLPVVIKRIEDDPAKTKAMVCPGFFPGFGHAAAYDKPPDASVHPQLWDLLLEINSKLNLVLEKLCFENEGLTRAESKQVSLSAAGIRIRTRARYDLGATLEVQMLINTTGPVWVVVYGEVARLVDLADGECEVAINFFDMEDDVRDLINLYTLKRQREIIRKQRGYGE
jgi:hypothetical protein